jgi:Domain of unknown function (DUF4326)
VAVLLADELVAPREELADAFAATIRGAAATFVCWCAPHACHADILLKVVNDCDAAQA